MNHNATADAVSPSIPTPTIESFDQDLYDKTMAASPYAWDDEHPFDDDYLDQAEGYLQAARRAATIAADRTHPAGDCAHCGDNRYAKWEVVSLNRELAQANAELKRRIEDIPGAFEAFADSVCWDMTQGEGHTPDGEPAPFWVISPDTLKRFAEVYHTYPIGEPDAATDAWWERAEHYALTGEAEVAE